MQVENSYQRFISHVDMGVHHLAFVVTDTKGKDTDVSYNRDKADWFCACKGFSVRKKCGHVDVCKEYVRKYGTLALLESEVKAALKSNIEVMLKELKAIGYKGLRRQE